MYKVSEASLYMYVLSPSASVSIFFPSLSPFLPPSLPPSLLPPPSSYTQGKWSMNTDFHGVKGVHLCTVRTPYTRCKSPRKSVVTPCKSVVIPWYHYGLTRTFATCVWCAHGAKMDSFDPVEVCIHGPFSLCYVPPFLPPSLPPPSLPPSLPPPFSPPSLPPSLTACLLYGCNGISWHEKIIGKKDISKYGVEED